MERAKAIVISQHFRGPRIEGYLAMELGSIKINREKVLQTCVTEYST